MAMKGMDLSRRSLLGGAAGMALMISTEGLAAVTRPRQKPNFIVILCDDLGYGDTGPFGNTRVRTPNLDRMAREGTVLSSYYAPANLCTPSRAGLLTGRYPVRTGLARAVIQAAEKRGLPRSEVTIAQALKPAGYASALFGKWHLGHTGDYWPPTHYGFDRFYGIPYSHDMVPLAIFDAHAGVAEVKQEPVDFAYPGALKVKPGVDDVANYTSSLEEKLYDQAAGFIESNKDRPFYLELALTTPHLPEIPSKDFKGRSKLGPYADTVEEIDAIVGKLLDTVQRLGLEKDTLVLFTSDNGPWYWGNVTPLRDRKGGAAYDGGYRVPMIAWRPGWIHAGARYDALCSGIDLLPTFCKLAGVAPPAGVTLDGIDITATLQNGTALDREVVLFQGPEVVGIRTQKWKYIRLMPYPLFGYDELYDVQNDIGESYNLVALHPDVLKDMRERFERAKAIFQPMVKLQS
ncbi:sulfatase family protein [Novosphingobium rosa]|uniref:sulfatase family protein n=1 Tax=Novosphingobium rosa TaxID=76978 RepID=UPI000AE8DB20|nr:sulfatase [Novosphingobium rosa]